MKHKLIVWLLVIGATLAYAQRDWPMDMRPPRPDKDRMEMMTIWRLTEDLELIEEQATKFFPAFREFRDSQKKIEDVENDFIKEWMEKTMEDGDISDKEYESVKNSLFEFQDQRESLQKEFLTKTEKYLNNKQSIRLAMANKRFKQKIKRHMMEKDPYDNRMKSRRRSY